MIDADGSQVGIITPEFREEERTFRDYERADLCLNQLSAALR
jgi:hypothetical protein